MEGLSEALRAYYGFRRRLRKFAEITGEGVKELGEVLKILRKVTGDD